MGWVRKKWIMENFFKLLKKDKQTQARVGEINTSHGKILTPAFCPVGSQATVKSLTPQDLKEIGVQAFFVNTYHLYLRPGAEVVEKLGGLHKFMDWYGPIMTDSGGFQVFSLGRIEGDDTLKSSTTGPVAGSSRPTASPDFVGVQALDGTPSVRATRRDSQHFPLVEIDYDGVTFRSHLDGSKHYFTPEKSIEIQQKLGADMIVAFDECAPYPTTHQYAEMAMKRTHRWALHSLAAKKRKDQFILLRPPVGGLRKDFAPRRRRRYRATQSGAGSFIFGVIQGSVFKDLREESAQFITSKNFDGLAIGGVAVGESKKEMAQVLNWVMPIFAKNKNLRPIHLLGVGEIDDIFAAVERGVDMMDCVMPTRLGRMGHVLVKQDVKRETRNEGFMVDITKSVFADDPRPIDEDCDCYVCKNFSRAYLNHLFRAKELLAYRLATYHNLYFMEQLFAKIREAIKKKEFLRLKKEWLG